MKVSIVTISFNQVQFIEETIRSVLEQDYPDIEYIIVDPGSTDGSRDIIERYKDKIDHIILKPDKGPADGLNKGFACATGEIFAYLNSDDTLVPGAVSRFVREFQNSDADVVSGHGYKIDDKGNILSKTFSHKFNPAAYVHGACVLIQQSTFFRAEAFRNVGGFNMENRVSWDGELCFDMAMAGARFSRIGGYWSCFRMHPESITVSGRVSQLEEQVKKRLAERLGQDAAKITDPVRMKWYWLKQRMTDPVVTFQRLLEAVR